MTDNAITITLDDVLGPDGMDGAYEALTKRLAERAEAKFFHSDGRSFHRVVTDAINEALHDRIAAKIAAKMSDPIQMTDQFGQPKGEKTTFNEMISAAIQSAMTQKWDNQGRPSSHGKTIMQQALEEVAGHELRAQVRAAVAEVREQAKEAVSREVAKAIAASIK